MSGKEHFNALIPDKMPDATEFRRVKSMQDANITKERNILSELERVESANDAKEKAYAAARTALENERKAAYDQERGVKTAMFRHSDGFTYLHEPGVELVYVEWTTRRSGRPMGIHKFRTESVLAVVWDRDDPRPSLPQETFDLKSQLKDIRAAIAHNAVRLVQLSE
jgi:hypothetical protein